MHEQLWLRMQTAEGPDQYFLDMLALLALKRRVNGTWQNVDLGKTEVGCEGHSGKKGWTPCVREAHPWKEFEQLETNVSHGGSQ